MLVTFGRFEQNGTLPNTIHGGNASNRDTSDAPLWFGVLCEETAARMGAHLYETVVDERGRTIADVLQSIAAGYARGTPNGIRMDPASALIWSPPHFTWMDTNFPACTPREGLSGGNPGPVDSPVASTATSGPSTRRRTVETLWRSGPDNPCKNSSGWKSKATWPTLLIANPGQPAAGAVPDQALRCNSLFAVAFGSSAASRPAAPSKPPSSASSCPAPCARWRPCPSRPRWSSRRPTAGPRTIRASRIGAAMRETKTRGANRPTTTAPPGPGCCPRPAKPWPAPGMSLPPPSPPPGPTWAAWNPYYCQAASASSRRFSTATPRTAARLRRPGLERPGGPAGLAPAWPSVNSLAAPRPCQSTLLGCKSSFTIEPSVAEIIITPMSAS